MSTLNKLRKRFYNLFLSGDDWWSVWIGLIIFSLSFISSIILFSIKKDLSNMILPGIWSFSNITNMYSHHGQIIGQCLMLILNLFLISISFYTINIAKTDLNIFRYCIGVSLLQIIVSFIFIISNYYICDIYGLKEELFAILIGIIIGNIVISFDNHNVIKDIFVVSCKPAEYYIKIGLVLLAMNFIEYGKLLLPAIILSWPAIVVEICIIYFIGTYFFSNNDRQLLIMLVVALSICGASAATCIKETIKGKQSDLAIVISVISVFTIIQMLTIPYIAKAIHIPLEIGSAWIGGTIDSTGSVVAAAGLFGGHEAIIIASTVKMVQNSVIGFVAVGILIIWCYTEETIPLSDQINDIQQKTPKKYISIIIERFPKFVIGFFLTSILVTILSLFIPHSMLQSLTLLVSSFSKFWFILGFFSIGFNTNYKLFAQSDETFNHKILICTILYIVGQTIDLTMKYGTSYMVGSMLKLNNTNVTF